MAGFTFGAAQIACVPGDVAANLALHRSAIAEARRRGVDLLVFPELSLTDYQAEPDTARLAMSAQAPALGELALASRGLAVVVGFIETNPAGRPFNSCALLQGGRVVHVHRKLNLPTYGSLQEGRHYSPGEGIDLADTRFGRAAILICADTWNPAWPWLAALAGAEVMIVPVASARGAVADDFDSRAGWDVTLRHAAMTYGVPIAMANHCGRRDRLDFWGGSAIYDAFGREVARAGTEAELVVARIDPTDGVRARERLPTIRDADPRRVGAGLDRLLAAPVARRCGS